MIIITITTPDHMASKPNVATEQFFIYMFMDIPISHAHFSTKVLRNHF